MSGGLSGPVCHLIGPPIGMAHPGDPAEQPVNTVRDLPSCQIGVQGGIRSPSGARPKSVRSPSGVGRTGVAPGPYRGRTGVVPLCRAG